MHSWRAVGTTQVGLVRQNNQDRILITDKGVYAIADGMGGLQDGAKAASLAVSIVDEYKQELQLSAARGSTNTLRGAFGKVVQAADSAILRMTRTEGRTAGTTLLLWTVHENQLAFAWVGDTALFLASANAVVKLTIDHTVAEDKRRKGIPDLVRPQDESTLTRSVGTGASSQPSFGLVDLSKYEGFFILGCSDGYAVLAHHQLTQAFSADVDIEMILRRLELGVLAAGASDNYSAILLGRIDG